MNENNVVLVGSRGHASVVLDAAKQMNRWTSFIAIGDNGVLERYMRELLTEGYSIATIVHPTAVIVSSAVIEEGSCVVAGAILNPFVKIAQGVIVNTSKLIKSFKKRCILRMIP